MRHSSLPLAALIAACLLAGCNRTDDAERAPSAVANDAPPVSTDTAPAATDASTDAITMRYECGEHRVDVMGNDHAQVTMSDGRVIKMPYVADSSPPMFGGEAVEFSIGGDGAQLAQDDGASWPCKAE